MKLDKKKLLIIVAAVLAVAAVVAVTTVFINQHKYSKHTFEYMDEGFSWDMTKEEAAKYIEKYTVQPWRTIDVTENEVEDGFYHFDFDSDGKLYRVRFNMGMDRSIVETLNEWFGEYDKHTTSKYGSFGYYYWYGMMEGKKTRALLYCPDSTVYLHFELEE